MGSLQEKRQPESDGMDLDVVIIGAGISGINAAYKIQKEGPPGMTYAILESRETLGGTWDLFKYPGIRSDSDVFTFCFSWSPWNDTLKSGALASGPQIKEYMQRSARSAGIDQHILYRHSVISADWDSSTKKWNLKVSVGGQEGTVTFTTRFILLGTGYYDYEKPLNTTIPGLENFGGRVIHPQFWPSEKKFDPTNQHIVVIGSGATAVTLVPALAGQGAKRVTMLQRSPSYIFPLARHSLFVTLLFTLLPLSWAYAITRAFWLVRSHATTWVCRAFPNQARAIFKRVNLSLLPRDGSVPWDPHFKPAYNPWDQRVCATADGDFFAALRAGKAGVATGTIKEVTRTGITLASGERIENVDTIVTATGLKIRFGGGIQFSVDKVPVKFHERFAWRSAMLQDVPNVWFLTGYETASWTLGADVSVRWFNRVVKRMQEKGAVAVVPRVKERMPEKGMMSLSSTYLSTSRQVFPKGGSGVWAPKRNWFADIAQANWGSLEDGLEFVR